MHNADDFNGEDSLCEPICTWQQTVSQIQGNYKFVFMSSMWNRKGQRVLSLNEKLEA